MRSDTRTLSRSLLRVARRGPRPKSITSTPSRRWLDDGACGSPAFISTYSTCPTRSPRASPGGRRYSSLIVWVTAAQSSNSPSPTDTDSGHRVETDSDGVSSRIGTSLGRQGRLRPRLSVSRPIASAVEKFCVTDTNATSYAPKTAITGRSRGASSRGGRPCEAAVVTARWLN